MIFFACLSVFLSRHFYWKKRSDFVERLYGYDRIIVFSVCVVRVGE